MCPGQQSCQQHPATPLTSKVEGRLWPESCPRAHIPGLFGVTHTHRKHRHDESQVLIQGIQLLHLLWAKGEVKHLQMGSGGVRKASFVSGGLGSGTLPFSQSPGQTVSQWAEEQDRRITKYLDVLKDAGRCDTLGDADHFPLDLPPTVGDQSQ